MITDYNSLKAELVEFMAREDLANKTATVIQLAEANLNSELESVEIDANLVGVSDSREIDVSSLDIIEPMFLWMMKDQWDERQVLLKAPGSFPYLKYGGVPGFAEVNGNKIVLNRPQTEVYNFRFRYRGKFALSDEQPTNQLLTDRPDVYLAASVVWGGVYIRSSLITTGYQTLLNEYIASAKSSIAQRKRGVASVDPALATNWNPYWRNWGAVS